MTLQQKVAKSNHGGEQVIEVVGNAAGQLSDCLHLLRLGELLFKAFLFGSVNQVDDQSVAAVAGRIEFLHRADIEGSDFFFLVKFKVGIDAGGSDGTGGDFSEVFLGFGAVVGGHVFKQAVPAERFGFVMEKAGGGLVAGSDYSLFVGKDNAYRRIVEQPADFIKGGIQFVAELPVVREAGNNDAAGFYLLVFAKIS